MMFFIRYHFVRTNKVIDLKTLIDLRKILNLFKYTAITQVFFPVE